MWVLDDFDGEGGGADEVEEGLRRRGRKGAAADGEEEKFEIGEPNEEEGGGAAEVEGGEGEWEGGEEEDDGEEREESEEAFGDGG